MRARMRNLERTMNETIGGLRERIQQLETAGIRFANLPGRIEQLNAEIEKLKLDSIKFGAVALKENKWDNADWLKSENGFEVDCPSSHPQGYHWHSIRAKMPVRPYKCAMLDMPTIFCYFEVEKQKEEKKIKDFSYGMIAFCILLILLHWSSFSSTKFRQINSRLDFVMHTMKRWLIDTWIQFRLVLWSWNPFIHLLLCECICCRLRPYHRKKLLCNNARQRAVETAAEEQACKTIETIMFTIRPIFSMLYRMRTNKRKEKYSNEEKVFDFDDKNREIKNKINQEKIVDKMLEEAKDNELEAAKILNELNDMKKALKIKELALATEDYDGQIVAIRAKMEFRKELLKMAKQKREEAFAIMGK